jgi:hypothetical protein
MTRTELMLSAGDVTPSRAARLKGIKAPKKTATPEQE